MIRETTIMRTLYMRLWISATFIAAALTLDVLRATL
jgi:hypothetical protein